MVYTAWATTGDTCATAPVGPAAVVVPFVPDNCATTTFSEVAACPVAGQTGHILRTRDYDTCAGTYTPWVVASDSCVSPAPGTVCTPSSRTQTVACPPGLSGAIVQTQSSYCPSTYATQVWPSTWDQVSNTCTGNGGMCTVQREVGPIPCGAGSYGPWDGEHERFLNCVNATTQSPGWTAYTVLTPNLGCVSCPATNTETSFAWQAYSSACPAGFTGSQDWEYETVSTRTVSYNCPTGTVVLPSPDYGTWSVPAATGSTRNFVDNCVAATCTGPASETQLVATTGGCPNGHTGNQTWDREQIRTRTCNSGTWSSYGSWADTGSTTNFVDNCVASTCTGPSSESQWLSGSAACPVGETGTNTWEYEQTRSRTCNSGTWGAWGGWTNTGATRNEVNTCASASCRWVWQGASYPPSWNQDTGGMIVFDDGAGGGCSAGYGCFSPDDRDPYNHKASDLAAFNACMAMWNTSQPKGPSAWAAIDYSTNLMSPCETMNEQWAADCTSP